MFSINDRDWIPCLANQLYKLVHTFRLLLRRMTTSSPWWPWKANEKKINIQNFKIL